MRLSPLSIFRAETGPYSMNKTLQCFNSDLFRVIVVSLSGCLVGIKTSLPIDPQRLERSTSGSRAILIDDLSLIEG